MARAVLPGHRVAREVVEVGRDRLALGVEVQGRQQLEERQAFRHVDDFRHVAGVASGIVQ